MRHLALLLLPLYLVAVLAGIQWVPPIAQDPAYHAFADQREWLGIPNFADVASNLPLLVAGLWGLGTVLTGARTGTGFARAAERRIAGVFFAAVAATAVGSAWYHLAPDNARLFWDRLPLALAFTSLPALLIAERAPITRGAATLLGAWMLVGPASVLYWHIGELAGSSDLRPYFLLHGFMLVLPPLLIALPTPFSHRHLVGIAFVLYLLAMAGDLFDHAVFGWLGGLVSGHTLKHLLVGVATALLVRRLQIRHCRRAEHSQRQSGAG